MQIWLFVLMLMVGTLVNADEQQTFQDWQQELKADSLREGISKQTVEATFKQAKLLPRVIALDRSQPEFISTFLNYLERRVTLGVIERGRDQLSKHQTLLDNVESEYGVPKHILVAFWGMETHYGGFQGDIDLPSALMTLAYEGRRAVFFSQSVV